MLVLIVVRRALSGGSESCMSSKQRVFAEKDRFKPRNNAMLTLVGRQQVVEGVEVEMTCFPCPD